jgi:hypothetical protein
MAIFGEYLVIVMHGYNGHLINEQGNKANCHVLLEICPNGY